jgi:nucleoside 2-deoxyribosyltransferase
MKPLVYLAGPYTRPDPVENVHKTCKVADVVLEMGAIPFIPHLTHTYHLVSPKPLEFWYEYDIHTMLRCDAVLRLAGDSTGADKEVSVAVEKGIPVFYGLDELGKWIAEQSRWTPVGSESHGLPDGESLPPELAAQIRFLERYLSSRQDVPSEEIPLCIEKFIKGALEHRPHQDWRTMDIAEEIAAEQRDIWNYECMEAMLEAGL